MKETALFSSTDVSSSKDRVGCCSHYLECSNEGSCIVPDRDYAQTCSYRKNLETGKILFGKRSQYFDEALYADFQKRAAALDEAHLSALLGILNYFFNTKRGSSRALFYSKEEYRSLADIGFFHIESSIDVLSSIVVHRCNVKALKEACGDRLQDATQWALASRKETDQEANKPAIRREELEEWVLSHDRDALEKLCFGLVVLSLDPFPASFTLQEWFWDNKYGDYPLSLPDDDPRFLKQKG